MGELEFRHAMEVIEKLKDDEKIDEYAYLCMANGIKTAYDSIQVDSEEEESDSEYEPSFIDDESIASDPVSDTGERNVTITVLTPPAPINDKLFLWVDGIIIGILLTLTSQTIYSTLSV